MLSTRCTPAELTRRWRSLRDTMRPRTAVDSRTETAEISILTHGQIIAQVHATLPDEQWARLHLAAYRHAPTTKFSGCIAKMVDALACYADNHRARYGTGIGLNVFVGPAWVESVRGVRSLLQGYLDNLDYGTIDKILCAMLVTEGFTP